MKCGVWTRERVAALALHVRREISDLTNTAPLYRMLTLSGSALDKVDLHPESLVKGDKAKGAAILTGRFVLVGETLDVPEDANIWDCRTPSRAFAEALHRFDWLADLLAVQDPEAVRLAVRLVDGWVSRFGSWNWFSWNVPILERRLWAWMMASRVLFDQADEGFASRLKSTSRQIRRLSRTINLIPMDRARLMAAVTLRLGGLVFGFPIRRQRCAQIALDKQLQLQLLPDGGHISRSPKAAADVLLALTILDQAAHKHGVSLSGEVNRALDRSAAFVHFCRLPGGGLTVFHGGSEGDARVLDAALRHVIGAKVSKRCGFNAAPNSGYHRLEAGGAVLLMDTGGPPPDPHLADVHASALAFEFTIPEGRLVVNCGWAEDQPRCWREAVRATAAHSALTLEETSSTRLRAAGWRRALLGSRVFASPEPVKVRRDEEDRGIWLEASHEGYRRAFGLSLRRRLFLSADGGDFRGEDGLLRPIEDGAPQNREPCYQFAIRFHLHPGVRVSLSRDSLSALLIMGNGGGWRFRTDGGPVRLERSVYLAAGSRPERSTQLVVTGEVGPCGAGEQSLNCVRWAFQRLDQAGAAG